MEAPPTIPPAPLIEAPVKPEELNEMVSKAIASAHVVAYIMSTEQIQESFRKSQIQYQAKIRYYKNKAELHKTQLWLECMQKLTEASEKIIEFAKMVPGFMKLLRYDQITLLKAGCFKLVAISMSRYYDLQRDCILFDDTIALPQDAFLTQDAAERRLVTSVFSIVKDIAELRLTEAELALFSAAVLLNHRQRGLLERTMLKLVYNRVMSALRYELDRRLVSPRADGVPVFDVLLSKIRTLRDVSRLHKDAFARLKNSEPHLNFPGLYSELYNIVPIRVAGA